MGCHRNVVWMFRDIEGMLLLVQVTSEMVCKKEEILLFGLLLTGFGNLYIYS